MREVQHIWAMGIFNPNGSGFQTRAAIPVCKCDSEYDVIQFAKSELTDTIKILVYRCKKWEYLQEAAMGF